MSVDSCHVTDDWKVYQLQELCDGGTLPYGIVQPGAHDEFGTPIVRVNNFRGNYIDCSDLLKVKPEISEKYKRTILKGNEVLLTIVGSVGQVACTNSSHVGFNVARAIAVIRPNNLIEAKWIALSLENPQAKETLLGGANTTVQTTINLKELRQLQIAVPPKSYRLKVINLLQSLEQLIENLRVQNTTLEALAQTLFRSWFVNFDPIHAKVAGQTPEGMSPELAALFPSEFVESELGMIPKGWKVESLDEKIIYLNGLALQKFPAQGKSSDLPVLKIAQLRAGRTDPSVLANVDAKPSYKIQDGDVIFSWSGTLEVLLWMGGECALNQHLFKVYSDSHPKWLCYLGTLHHLAEFRSVAESKQTTMGHIQRKHLSDAKICLPPAASVEKMHEVFHPIIETIINNAVAARKLGEVRDELLPRLISGKLRIEEAEEAVSEVLGSAAEEEKAA